MKIKYNYKPLIKCILWDVEPNKKLLRVRIMEEDNRLVECKVKKNTDSILNKVMEINKEDISNWYITIEDGKIKTLHYKDNTWTF